MSDCTDDQTSIHQWGVRKIGTVPIYPDDTDLWFLLVKNWTFPSKPSPFKNIANTPTKNDVPYGSTDYAWTDEPVKAAGTLPAQGHGSPLSLFNSHIMVLVNTPNGLKLYDPSYGEIRPYSAEAMFATLIEGVGYRRHDDPTQYRIWRSSDVPQSLWEDVDTYP